MRGRKLPLFRSYSVACLFYNVLQIRGFLVFVNGCYVYFYSFDSGGKKCGRYGGK